MAVSQETCDKAKKNIAENFNEYAQKINKVQADLKKVKAKCARTDPDLTTIETFDNSHQVEAFRLYKRAQVRIKLLSSIVKITGMINAAAGFIATLVEVLR